MISRTSIRPGSRRSTSIASGFTLLEVLVAIVILSFGVLGVVGLQAASLRSNKEARNQASAVRLGRELAELMRGNKAVAVQTTTAANPYLIPTPLSLPATANPADPPENCFTGACSSAINVAKFEIVEWERRVRDELPGARVAVCFDQTPYTTTGRPQWDCNAGTSGVVVLKMGWSQRSLDSSVAGASAVDSATDSTSAPIVVLPLTAGSTE